MVLVVVGALSLPVLLYLGWHAKIALIDNPHYADAVFAPILSDYTVLASRAYHRLGGEGWDCTYAIVTLPTDAPAMPPEPLGDANWHLRFGGDWRPTPAPPLGDTTRDALDFCARYFDAGTNATLARAIADPEGWYTRDLVGETLSLYAPQARIAARIRFGD